jgi:hypothetical protein
MSFTANTAFEARVVNDRFDDLANIPGKFYVSTTPTDCSAGQLCIRDSLLACEGFANVKNENTWKMVTATNSTTANTPIYACDPHDWPLLAGKNGNLFAVGTETLGLGIPAGRYGSFRRVHFDNESIYRFGVGNLSATLSTNTFLTISSSGTLTPAASAPVTAGTPYFKVMGTGNFTEGTSASFGYVDAMACVD